jgi:large subunit ribosomal protein L23
MTAPRINIERLYNVLRAPRFTEKATAVGDKANQYVFEVALDATKPEVKAAVEHIFKVRVVGVTTLRTKPVTRRTARGTARTKGFKKAYVRIESGKEIDFGALE